MDGTILNSLCLLSHIYESIQPSLSNGTSACDRDHSISVPKLTANSWVWHHLVRLKCQDLNAEEYCL